MNYFNPTIHSQYNWQILNQNISATQKKYMEAAALLPLLSSKMCELLGGNMNFDPAATVKIFTHMMASSTEPSQFLSQMQSIATWLSSIPSFNFNTSNASSDKRFRDPDWTANPFFAFIKDYYEKSSQFFENIADTFPAPSFKDKQKISFYTKQCLDSLSPTNFPLLNPEVIKETLNTQGANLLHGAEIFLSDVKRACETGKFLISTNDQKNFEVGVNIAATPGKVVFRNELFELIHYTPTTNKVYRHPILIIPAWINKYYIMDLQQTNSFVKWLVDNGHTVFMMSWVNPDASYANKTFEDYMITGVVTAIEIVRSMTNNEKINCMSYCLGGTMLAIALAYLAKKSRLDSYINSATFMNTLIEFTNVGDIGVFIDEIQLQAIDSIMKKQGYLDGYYMEICFNILRAKDMIWNYYVSNYLLGKAPREFDILFWNSDSTRLAYATHSYYLRKLYLENALIKKGGLFLGGVDIDLSTINIPTYILGTKEDHIAPWESTYIATQTYTGIKRFVLGGSGHTAGMVNHPSKNKYYYRTNDQHPKNPKDWLHGSKETMGSWWLDWANWISNFGKEMIEARTPDKKKSLDNAPGTYIKMK